MSHRRLLWLAATWQFIYVMDFVMPMPLGPVLSSELGFPAPAMAWLSVSYTLASMVAGLFASLMVVERFGKAKVILAGLTGFTLANAATVWTDDLAGLLVCRAVAALSGAPVVAMLMSEVVDRTPPEGRGRALSTVMSGASLAIVLGVPLAVGVAHLTDWRLAFVLISVGSAVIWVMAKLAGLGTEPSPRMGPEEPPAGFRSGPAVLMQLMRDASVRHALRLQMLSHFATFLVIPVLATFLVSNLRIAASQIPLVYAAGGAASILCMRASGRLSDRLGYRKPLWVACIVLMLTLFAMAWSPAWLAERPWLAMATFMAFMAANAAKNVALASYTASAPAPGMRASFMNLQGSLQDAAILLSALGPLLMLTQSSTDAPIHGMSALLALALVAMLTLMIVDVLGTSLRAKAVTQLS